MKIIKGLVATMTVFTLFVGAAVVALFAILGATGFALFRFGSSAEKTESIVDFEPTPYEPMTLEEVRAL